MLDLVSGGRVELGTGETSSGAELEGFGVDRETKRAQWEEMLPVVARMMVEEPFAGTDGRFLSMPPRNVVPKPIQKPHPPLWVACSRRETIRLAAQKGIGALSFSFVEPEEAKAWVDEYHAIVASERCVPGGFAVNPQVACVLPMMCAPDEAQAIERGIDGAHFFGYSLAHYYVFGDHRPGRTNIYEEFLARRDDVGFARSIITADAAPLGVRVLQQGLGSLRGAIGSPEQVRRPVPALRGGRGRPADLRDAGRAQPPRAHLRVDRAVRRRGPARVRRARRRGRCRSAPSASRPRSRPRWPAASRRAWPIPTTRSGPTASGPPARSRAARARAVQRPRAAGGGPGAAGRAGRARLPGLRAALRRPPPGAHRGLGARAEGALRRHGAGLRARQGGRLQRRAAVRPAPLRRRAGRAGRWRWGPSARASARARPSRPR